MDIITPTQTKLNSPTLGAPIPSLDSSLEELRAVKAAWLRQARESGDLDNLAMVTKTLGSVSTPRGWPMWKQYELTRGNVRARLFEGTGAYIPGLRDYGKIRTLTIEADGYRVCYFRQSDFGDPEDDNVFVPGQWQRVILAELEKAQAVYAARLERAAEEERQALLEQLLIGVGV